MKADQRGTRAAVASVAWREGDAEPPHLAIEGIAPDPELLRDAADVAVVQLDLLQQRATLRLLQGIQALGLGRQLAFRGRLALRLAHAVIGGQAAAIEAVA